MNAATAARGRSRLESGSSEASSAAQRSGIVATRCAGSICGRTRARISAEDAAGFERPGIHAEPVLEARLRQRVHRRPATARVGRALHDCRSYVHGVPRTTLVLLAVWMVTACASSRTGEAGDPCARASDCAVAELSCVYDVSLGCTTTTGVCRNVHADASSAFCQGGYVGCGCEGAPVTVPVCWGLERSPAPLRSTSPCSAESADAGGSGPTLRDASTLFDAVADAPSADGRSSD